MEHVPPVLWLLAGPNGAGKSTYYDEHVSRVFRAPFVNADRLAQRMFGRHPRSDVEMRRAAEASEQERAALLQRGESFVAETVFSHESKLELMRAAVARGYLVRLSFVCVEGAELCAMRVRARVDAGGHDVPLDKIQGRYARSLEHAKHGVRIAHWAVVLDNTSMRRPHRPVLQYSEGVLRARRPPIPKWARGFPSV